MTVEVVQTAPVQIEVTSASAPTIETQTQTEMIDVRTYVSQIVAGGMFVETNIGGDPDAFTIWIEDGN